MAKKGTEVAENVSGGELILNDRPAWLRDEGRGSEEMSIDDLTIPRVDVIQDLSPQHKENKPEYIPGAKVGDLFNTVTGEIYGKEVVFVPVYFKKEYIIWKSRKAGGGFKGAFDTELEAETARKHLEDGDKCEVVDTAQHFGVIIDSSGKMTEVIISMSKSKMKVSRKFNSMVKLAGGDRFSRAYEISAIPDQNANGEDFWNLSVRMLGYVNQATYEKAESMYEAVRAGVRTINRGEHSSIDEQPDGSVGGDDEF